MKPAIFSLLISLIFFPGLSLSGQDRSDTAKKKQATISNNARLQQYRADTTHKPANNPPTDTNPKPPASQPETGNADKPRRDHGGFIHLDTIRPVPVETHTLVRSVLRSQNIFANDDAIELVGLLNPRINSRDSLMSNYQLILPRFPEPDADIKKSVKREFKDDLEADENVNNLYFVAARRLDTLANIFSVKNFELDDVEDNKIYNVIQKYLPALSELAGLASKKIKHTSRKTISTLVTETDALNTLLSKYDSSSTLSGENINRIYSLMVDMNTLLYVITGRGLQIATANRNSYFINGPFHYSFVSYDVSLNNGSGDKQLSGDDDPRKFNIYIFRKALVESTGKRDPEMKNYTIGYVIPALAQDDDEWSFLPEPASTTHCYFSPARFKFSIKDNKTGTIYYATADLYDAQKDPNEKWTIVDFINPHPTYRLLFLIP